MVAVKDYNIIEQLQFDSVKDTVDTIFTKVDKNPSGGLEKFEFGVVCNTIGQNSGFQPIPDDDFDKMFDALKGDDNSVSRFELDKLFTDL